MTKDLIMYNSQIISSPLSVSLSILSTLGDVTVAKFSGPSHTFVRNWYNMIFTNFTSFTPPGTTYGPGYLGNKTVSGTAVTGGFAYNFSLIGAINSSGSGIVVGRGSTAESVEAYALATQIVHGSAVNQLVHAAGSATTATYTPATKTWASTLLRVFNNNSAAQIDVTENGIYINYGYGQFMLTRDLLAAPVPVAVGGQLTVSYTMSMVFPD